MNDLEKQARAADAALAEGGSLIEQIMAETRLKPSDEGYETAKRGVGAFIAELLAPNRAGEKVEQKFVDAMIAEIDKKLSGQVDEILHNENFQKLESAWRGLKMVVDRTDFRENVKLELLNVSKEQLLEDFEDAPDVTKSGLYKHMYAAEYGQFGGQPYSDDNREVAYNNEAFEGFVEMSGEAIYNEWTPYEVTPLTDDAMLTIGTPEEPDTINPVASTSVWGWKFLRMYYDKLVRLSPDVEPEMWAAEAIGTPDDTTYEVTLREGMTFHDGEPVTVDDIVFTFEYYIANQFGYFMPFLDMIESVEAPDERTVVFNLAEPFGPFINVTLAQIPILPQHVWADIDNPADLAPDEIPTVGSGPFQFDRFDAGEYKALTVFEDHWTAGNIAIEGIDYNVYADAEGVFTGLQTQEIDMTAWRLEPGQIPLAEDEDNLTVVNAPDFGYYHLTWNLREEPFDDVAVRQALSHAIDKGTIIDVLRDGRGEPGTSVVAPSNPTWHNPDITAYDYDLDRAREILQDAGYGWNEEGQIVRP
jgi:hypothetical protein